MKIRCSQKAVAFLCGIGLLLPFYQANCAVVAWGNRPNSVLDVPPGLNDVTALAGGWSHALALKANGTVVAWGNNSFGQTNIPPGLSNVVAIEATYFGSAALKSDGLVVVWGQIDTLVSSSSAQLDVSDGVGLAAGGRGLTVLRKNGTLKGYGWAGEKPPFGNYSNVSAVSLSPTDQPALLALTTSGKVEYWGPWDLPTTGLSSITACSFGAGHALFLKSDGSVLALGNNEEGQSSVPEPLHDVHSVVAGDRISGAIYRKDRVVKTWGENFSGVRNVPPGLFGVESVTFLKGGGALAIVKDPVVHAAVATAELVNGFLVRIRIEDGGYGYAEQPRIEIEGGGATAEARVTAVMAHNRLEGIVVEDAGFGYLTVPKIKIAPPTTPPRVISKVSQVRLSLNLFAGGEYQLYSSPDLIDWEAHGVSFVANQDFVELPQSSTNSAKFFKLELLSKEPTLLPNLDAINTTTSIQDSNTHLPETFHRARARAEMVNGFVVAAKVLDPGLGYTVPPLVSFGGGGGEGARAIAVVSNQRVVEIQMVGAGTKYTNAPVVLIGAPLIPPRMQISPSQYSLALHVTQGRRYQLQSSRDSVEWTRIGDSFEAGGALITRDYDILEHGLFVRLIEVP